MPAPLAGLQGFAGLSPEQLAGINQLAGAGLGPMLAGGGQIQAEQGFREAELATMMEEQRLGAGRQLMEYLTRIQQDPFSIVPALQAYGAAGGGTLGPAAALAASGGAGQPSPFGELQSRLMRVLSEQAGATLINPHTGQPFLPHEMDYLRRVGQQQLEARGATQTQAATELARAEPQRQSVRPDIYQLPTGGRNIFAPLPQQQPTAPARQRKRSVAPLAGVQRFRARGR